VRGTQQIWTPWHGKKFEILVFLSLSVDILSGGELKEKFVNETLGQYNFCVPADKFECRKWFVNQLRNSESSRFCTGRDLGFWSIFNCANARRIKLANEKGSNAASKQKRVAVRKIESYRRKSQIGCIFPHFQINVGALLEQLASDGIQIGIRARDAQFGLCTGESATDALQLMAGGQFIHINGFNVLDRKNGDAVMVKFNKALAGLDTAAFVICRVWQPRLMNMEDQGRTVNENDTDDDADADDDDNADVDMDDDNADVDMEANGFVSDQTRATEQLDERVGCELTKRVANSARAVKAKSLAAIDAGLRPWSAEMRAKKERRLVDLAAQLEASTHLSPFKIQRLNEQHKQLAARIVLQDHVNAIQDYTNQINQILATLADTQLPDTAG
jgi:hypothetical protein